MNNFDLNTLVRPNILKMAPYSSARDEFSGSNMVFLDANENPWETTNNRYPDPKQEALKKAIAEIKGLEVKNIFLGNGSDEAIDIVMRAVGTPGKDNILITQPTYGVYEVSAAINDLDIIRYPLNKNYELDGDELLTFTNQNTRIIFLCSPNNPTANILQKQEVEKVLNHFNGLVVIDEAYIDFSQEKSWSEKLGLYPNLIVLQTLSKGWGLAGLRIGMAYASENIIRILNKIKPPYNISNASQRIALEALSSKRDLVAEQIDRLIEERNKYFSLFSKLPFVKKVFPSEANFLLLEVENTDALYQYLIDQGFVTRKRKGILHCAEGIRFSIGTPEENKNMYEALLNFEGK
ncbi:MAG: histidinol-phosphate transaminase [Cyclobacteriaceae bacterium]|nr:histidinol-phosphate transaminase [Cyclobacteriaceae bacterium]